MKLTEPPGASRTYTYLWLGWIGAFFVIEFSALARKQPQNTLSDRIWCWFGIPRHPAPPRNIRLRRIALGGFLAWLVGHFLTGDDV